MPPKLETVLYQGAEGAFSHIVAQRHLGPSYHYEGRSTFSSVFKGLQMKEAVLAILPIENSLIGSIYEVYDLLGGLTSFQIVGEEFLRIEHSLMAFDSNIKQIKQVLSHPKALQQCSQFFQNHPEIQQIVFEDTAAAAREVALRKDPTLGAIASKEAADIYRLQVLCENLEDNVHNYTRFVVIGPQLRQSAECDKGTIQVTLQHRRGALLALLEVLDGLALNLTKIESRPWVGNPFEYIFYIDFEAKGLGWDWWEDHKSSIEEAVSSVRPLGFYTGAKLLGEKQ
jgi:prephenate dehydratase